jgi:hypothetical protein
MDLMAIALTFMLSVGFGLVGSRALLGGLLCSAKALDGRRQLRPAEHENLMPLPPRA